MANTGKNMRNNWKKTLLSEYKPDWKKMEVVGTLKNMSRYKVKKICDRSKNKYAKTCEMCKNMRKYAKICETMRKYAIMR